MLNPDKCLRRFDEVNKPDIYFSTRIKTENPNHKRSYSGKSGCRALLGAVKLNKTFAFSTLFFVFAKSVHKKRVDLQVD